MLPESVEVDFLMTSLGIPSETGVLTPPSPPPAIGVEAMVGVQLAEFADVIEGVV